MRHMKTNLLKNESGAVAVYTAIVLAVLVMFTALAVDVNHLYAVRNELHNGADSGALAGAMVLFDDDGVLTRQAALDEGRRITSLNQTGDQNIAEMVVETGHWSLTNKKFTASDNTTQIDWQEVPFSVLDLDPDYINAVRVRADRSDTPSFFAKIFGYDKFFVSADAVAYIGFAGAVGPGELDQPIAICWESIVDDPLADPPTFSCNMGRMLNSGSNTATSNTGGWTNFTQPCETASASDMVDLVCRNGNLEELQTGQGIGSTGGVQDNVFADLSDCWEAETGKTTAWNLNLPVVKCPGNNVGNCAEFVGTVNLNIIWIVHQNDPQYNNVPREMDVNGDSWTCSDPAGGLPCWKEFVNHYNLVNVDSIEPPWEDDAVYEEMYQKKNIFFLPDCEEHEPKGRTGGVDTGVMADIPVLVE